MTVQESTPWQPAHLDDLLNAPFERLREQQAEQQLARLEQMLLELDQMEQEMDAILERAPAGAYRPGPPTVDSHR